MGVSIAGMASSLGSGIAGAVSSKENAEAQNALYEQLNAPVLQYQQQMLPILQNMMANYTMPYMEQVYPTQLNNMMEFGIPIQEQQLQRALSDIYGIKGDFYINMANRGFEGAQAPEVPQLQDMSQQLSDAIYFNQARDISSAYDRERQALSDSLASSNMLRSGIGQEEFSNLYGDEMGDIYGLAQQRAGAETDLSRQNALWGYNQGINRYTAQNEADQAALRSQMAFLGMQQANPTTYPDVNVAMPNTGISNPNYNQMQFYPTGFSQMGNNIGMGIYDMSSGY